MRKAKWMIFWAGILLPAIPASAQEPTATELASVPLLIFEPPTSSNILFNKPAEQYNDYAWRSFIALNWPAKAETGEERGKPDLRARRPGRCPSGDGGCVMVWESWPYTEQVFLPSGNWDDYPTWAELPVTPEWPPPSNPPPPPHVVCKADPAGSIFLQAINQPGLSIKDGPVGPLADQNRFYVRYQVGLNRTYFEYVRRQRYYDARQQNPADFETVPKDQPDQPGMIEYKSAWKVLNETEQQNGRFYVRQAYMLSLDGRSCDPQPKAVGLVAFHIHRRTEFGHVAMTFEQVDNVRVSASRFGFPPAPVPSFNPGLLSPHPPPYGMRGFRGKNPVVIGLGDCPQNNCVTTDERHAPPQAVPALPRDVSRATPIPDLVQKANARYRTLLAKLESPLQFYRLIGTQHADPSCSRDWASGKWSPGCPRPNADALINAALESYTQLVNLKGQAESYSCRSCHQHARPCGISWSVVDEYTGNLMSYLLSKAKKPDTTYEEVVDGYNCNRE